MGSGWNIGRSLHGPFVRTPIQLNVMQYNRSATNSTFKRIIMLRFDAVREALIHVFLIFFYPQVYKLGGQSIRKKIQINIVYWKTYCSKNTFWTVSIKNGILLSSIRWAVVWKCFWIDRCTYWSGCWMYYLLKWSDTVCVFCCRLCILWELLQ